MRQPPALFPPKKIATRVKHRILQSCLKAWGGIIITSNAGRQVRLAFVDTCCGSGLYQPGDDIEIDVGYDAGSALIGIETLNDLLSHGSSVGRDVSAKALFINENSAELATLSTVIARHIQHPVPYRLLPSRLGQVVTDITSFCEKHFAFLFIDPYGPSAIPFSVVSQLVSLNRADCLINFPYYSIQKWCGWLDSGEGESRLAIVDQLLNGHTWREIARRNRHNTSGLEEAILNHYMDQLTGLGVAAISIPMSFEDRNRTMYHLVFTSRNTAGLAMAKKELQQAEAYQAALKAQLKASKQHQGMFGFMGPDDPIQDPVDINALATDIEARFRGLSVTKDDVIRYGLLKPNVLETHVSKALTRLKLTKVASLSGTRYRDTIKFAS
jgi:three-Cys-motif partner protein